jgi:hypothetical protein
MKDIVMTCICTPSVVWTAFWVRIIQSMEFSITHIFGDSGCLLRPYLMAPYEGANLGANELPFNKRMSKGRVRVKWAFKDIKKHYLHIAFPRKIVLSRTPGVAWYLASCLLWNFRCCIDGSPSSTFFDCNPPGLSHYLSILETD